MTKREKERLDKWVHEQQQEKWRRDQLLARVLKEINSGNKPRVTPEEAERLIIDASKTKKHRGPLSIRTFRG
jgi:hypothetical protein